MPCPYQQVLSFLWNDPAHRQDSPGCQGRGLRTVYRDRIGNAYHFPGIELMDIPFSVPPCQSDYAVGVTGCQTSAASCPGIFAVEDVEVLPGDGLESPGGRSIDSGPAGIYDDDDIRAVFAVQLSEPDDAEPVPVQEETVFCTGQVVDGYAAVYVKEGLAAPA